MLRKKLDIVITSSRETICLCARGNLWIVMIVTWTCVKDYRSSIEPMRATLTLWPSGSKVCTAYSRWNIAGSNGRSNIVHDRSIVQRTVNVPLGLQVSYVSLLSLMCESTKYRLILVRIAICDMILHSLISRVRESHRGDWWKVRAKRTDGVFVVKRRSTRCSHNICNRY